MRIPFFATEKARSDALEALAGYRVQGAHSRRESRRMKPQRDPCYTGVLAKYHFPEMAIEVFAHVLQYASEMRQARVLMTNLRGSLSRPLPYSETNVPGLLNFHKRAHRI